MHTLRDTATLAVLILLALTLRVNMDGKPLEWAVGPTAEAASEATVLPLAPAAESETQLEEGCCGTESVRPATGQVAGEARSYVWEFDGRRVIILVETDEEVQADVEVDTTHDSCGRTVQAHLSS